MPLDTHLDPIEARVFGVLIEKALTTPDQYPLSLNATTNGANQKANRDPVLSLDEDQVASALYRLQQKYMAREVYPGQSRVTKYIHNGKDALGVDAPALAVLAELLMRGPQMPGELRSRASRMAAMETQEQLTGILAKLIEKGYVRRLPPSPGARAERYVQLLCPDLHPLEAPAPAYLARRDEDEEEDRQAVAVGASTLSTRVATLEKEVAELREQVQTLLGRLPAQ